MDEHDVPGPDERELRQAADHVLRRFGDRLSPDPHALLAVQKGVTRIVARIVPDAEVDDVVQTTIVRLIDRSDARGDAWAFIQRVARDTALDSRRRRPWDASVRDAPALMASVPDVEAADEADRLLEVDAASLTVLGAMRAVAATEDAETLRIITEWLQAAGESGVPPTTRQVAARAGVSHVAVVRALSEFRRAMSAPPTTVSDQLRPGEAPRRIPALLGPDGAPLTKGSLEERKLEIQIAEISEELIALLAAKPRLLYELSPRRFEELVAELYRRRGFQATLTPSSGDGGVDVYVVRHDELGVSLSVVQCKRYGPRNVIGPGLVRELQGTVMGTGASRGVLLTTSFFTKGARAIERRFPYQLSLQDFEALHTLLKLPPTAPPM